MHPLTKFQGVERELQRGHYVFTAHSQCTIWGYDIFIRFSRWRKSKAGIDDFCVSAKRDGECLYGPASLPLGRTIEVFDNQYKYRITARYGVGIILARDQVGFDVNRELIKH